MSKRFDVIVIGLGGMGSATAYQLAARGKQVLGLDQYTAAHNKGSSHGKSRVIRQAYYEDPSYVPLLLRAYELWRDMEKVSGQQLLVETGGLMIGPPDGWVVGGSINSAKEHGLDHEVLDAAAINKRFPQFTPPPEEIALYERKAGFVFVERSIGAYLDAAAAHGAELHFEEPVQKWEATDSGVKVTTGKGTYEAEKLAIAPGAWAPELLADMGLPLEVERQVQYFFDPVGGTEQFLPENMPIYMWECGADGRLFYGLPSLDGPEGGIKVAFHYKGIPCTPHTIDRTVQPDEIDRMRAQLAPRIPALNAPCLKTITCMYTNTPDKHFVIANHPRHRNVTVAAGFSGHGYKFASVVGEIVAELVVDGQTRHNIELFTPSRLAG